MRNATGPLDILLLVPFEPVSSFVIEPHVRQDFAVAYTSLMQAAVEFGEYLGCDLPVQPTIGAPPPRFALRSLSAITLATHLEREGLDWAALDPGEQDLGAWRRDLERLRGAPPRTIAVCTTFLIGGRWPSVLLSMLRELFPDSKILLGGYFYATDSQAFLSLDADVYCVGEGELRLPAIVKAILAGRTLDDIPGLYLRQGGGALRYTGPVEQLDLGALPPVDWTLAGSERMEPRLDPERDSVAMGVETQRGCVFKCEFCTYRTLIGPNVMAPEAAVDAIMRCAVVKHGYIALVDATGTFPHDRWEEILYLLIARGGAPHPIWMYGRVSDLSERTAALMARAGVTAVFVGQESGDQRILQAMKKGTRTSQIRPAVAVLGKHGIVGQFGFIHGFPGEDEESLRNTRHVMATLNDGFERRPVVLVASVGPMHHQDLSASGYRSRAEHRPDSVWRDTWNRLFANPAQFPQRPGGWGHAVIETYMMLSRIPHAPAWDIFHGGDPRDQLHISFYASPHRPTRLRTTCWRA